MKIKEWYKGRIERNKGDYPHSSLWDFCKALPEKDGKWLWYQLWSFEIVLAILCTMLGVAYGYILAGKL